jgi:hypothetical protein
MARLESKISEQIIRGLNKHPMTWAYKRFAPAGNEAGQPDITGVSHGMRLEFETKNPSRLSNREYKILSGLYSSKDLACLENICTQDTPDNLESIITLYQRGLEMASDRQVYYLKKYSQLGAITGVVFEQNMALWLIKSQYLRANIKSMIEMEHRKRGAAPAI